MKEIFVKFARLIFSLIFPHKKYQHRQQNHHGGHNIVNINKKSQGQPRSSDSSESDGDTSADLLKDLAFRRTHTLHANFSNAQQNKPAVAKKASKKAAAKPSSRPGGGMSKSSGKKAVNADAPTESPTESDAKATTESKPKSTFKGFQGTAQKDTIDDSN